ncbi:c-type cytochrome [Candidatus Thiothrix anitrata]|uniref:c-type cytochrome n=1 Tax=Candidatus Thiothrix anitrata TaxID=2823902 RepID=UPI001D18E126|nr:c-type cytochrome [Candidatus Thiothrix anitrata]
MRRASLTLRIADWLYGGSPEQIKQSILAGRNGVMPPHKDRVDEAGIDALANYVMSLSGREADAAKVAQGQQLFTANGCLACHGMDGKGNQALGGPNLTDNIWLYGSSADTIKETIANGRMGRCLRTLTSLGKTRCTCWQLMCMGCRRRSETSSTLPSRERAKLLSLALEDDL